MHRIAALAIMLTLLAAGCGQTGDLYLPPPPEEEENDS